MIKNVTEIYGNSEKSELDVMTFHDVIRVANEKREGRCDALARDKPTNENARENLYIPVSLLGSVSWALGIPNLTPKQLANE